MGEFDKRAEHALNGIAEWMKYHSKSIYECTYGPETFIAPNGTQFTWNPSNSQLFLHLLDIKKSYRHKGMNNRLNYTELLKDRSEVKMFIKREDVVLKLKSDKINSVVPVIELYLKDK